MTDEIPLTQDVIFGRYKVLRKLGGGGMGTVFEAVHMDLGKRVAIKTLNPLLSASSELRQRFLREGRACSRIRHPNIVDVYDVALEGETPYLVMELLEGEDLASLLSREPQLSPMRAADVLVPVFAAVAAAHDCGIIHRDLKPANIFLSRERIDIRPKVVDFGISKLLEDQGLENLTATSAMLGTPYYMAPEQAIAARNLDARADQYSLGVILYECVAGKHPFTGTKPHGLFAAISAGRFERPRDLVSELPSQIDEIIVKAMSPDPAARYADVRVMGKGLLEFASAKTKTLYADELQDGLRPSPPVSTVPESAKAPSDAGRTTPWHSVTAIENVVSVSRNIRRLARWGFVGISAVIAMAFLARREARRFESPTPAPSAAMTSREPPPSAAVSAPSLIRRTLSSSPVGAAIFVNGVQVGTAPHALELPPDSAGIVVEVRLAGYTTVTRLVGPTDERDVDVLLEPIPLPLKRRVPASAQLRSPVPKLAPR